ncbi:MAG: methyltransferase domain-containing protein [Longimicrobiales bacterium]|nr:methyltransferase domain-containing protein [Longimicrobiales bacterium]
MWGRPPRLELDELIDAKGHDADELADSLRQVAWVDRLLGGERGVRGALTRIGVGASTRNGPERARTLLDVGAGNGRVVERLARWVGDASGEPPRVIALDQHPEIVAVGARERPHLAWVRADGTRLPLRDASVDLSICVLTLHHLDREGAIALLRELARVTRTAVLVSDLERSRLHWIGARLLAATVWRGNRLTREDGPTSVLRAWTADELRALLAEAGMPGADVRRHLPWRLVACARP